MRKLLYGLRIRIKLLAAFGSILLLSILLIVLSTKSIDRILYFKTVNEQVDRLTHKLDMLDLSYKEFMYEGYKLKDLFEKNTSPSVDEFNASYKDALEITASLQSDDGDDLKALTQTLDSLNQNFQKLVRLLTTRGFRDYGLEGSLRAAIHKVENSDAQYDKVSVLMLRRHEKDFFLRKDPHYQDEFNKRFDDFRTQVAASASPQLLASLDDYKKQFNKVVDIEKQIGFNEKSGIRGSIHDYFKKLSPKIAVVRTSIKERNESQITTTRWVLWIIFSIQIVAGIGMALLYSGLLTKAIKELRDGMLKLASGVFPKKLAVTSSEEIGQTKLAFNQFIDRLHAATSFAESLGAGILSSKYDSQFADDVLARSLINAQDQLSQAEEKQRKLNWTNEGAAHFNDILKNEGEELVLLGDRIIKLIVTYVKANQGALYILRGTIAEGFLERLSTYAYCKKKFSEDRIAPGAGLIGQCVLEGQTVCLHEVPHDYIKITSGLGEAPPRCILIVPLKIRNRVMGALELASFQVFQSFEIEFIERMAENVATLLAGRQDAEETRKLLEETRRNSNDHSNAQESLQTGNVERSKHNRIYL